MRKLIAIGALVLGMSAGAAQAAPVITFTPGGSGTPATETPVQTFDTYAAGTSLGNGTYVYSTTQPGTALRPTGTTLNYAAVTANGGYNVNFGQATMFSFVLGSLDAYNRLIVHYAGAPDQELDGTGIINNLGSVGSEGLVTYMSGSGPMFTGLSFGSVGANSFEFDTISAAVPEPAAWFMMILGFGLVGGVLRRRPSVKLRYA